MTELFERITEEKFNKLAIPVLFNDNNTSNCFAVFTKNGYSCRFSWQSKIVTPVVTKIRTYIYCIGIDLNFAVIDLEKKEIIININLAYLFFDAKIFNNYLYVILELEIIKFDILTFEMLKEYMLPDIIEGVTLKENQIEVQCWGGNILYIL